MCIFSSSFQNIYLVKGTIGEADLKIQKLLEPFSIFRSGNLVISSEECNAYVDATKIFRNIIK